jgi:predicted secreted hydrolase
VALVNRSQWPLVEVESAVKRCLSATAFRPETIALAFQSMADKWSYKQLFACLAALAVTMSVLIGVAGPAGASVARTATERSLSGSSVCSGSAASGQLSGDESYGSEPTSNASGVHLPKDEAPHHADDEWWYFSGHVLGIDSAGYLHCYGFEYVTFQFLHEAPEPVYFGDLSITDLTRGTFQYGVKEASYPVPNTPDRFDLHAGGWTMSGGSGTDNLHARLPGYELNLHLQTSEPAVLHGDDGVIPFGPFGTSKYYSWTSLLTTGTIIDHGDPVSVIGISWMDHQWGNFDFASGAGWDWFSMQLSNGQQYMLYFIRNSAGAIVQTIGTRVEPNGEATNLAPSTFAEQATGSWTSPATGITYSSGWNVGVPGGKLTVTPDLVDQELDLLDTQGVAYWEGDVSIQGQINGVPVAGVGYTEINPVGG